MGRVRQAYIKRKARELLMKYPDQFKLDFEHNKKVVRELLADDPHWRSKKDKNRLSGYITHLIKIGFLQEAKKETEMGEEPTVEEMAVGDELEASEGEE